VAWFHEGETREVPSPEASPSLEAAPGKIAKNKAPVGTDSD